MTVFDNVTCGPTSGSEVSWTLTMFDTALEDLKEGAGDKIDDLDRGMPGSLRFWEFQDRDFDFTRRFSTDIYRIGSDLAAGFNDPNIPTNLRSETGSQFNRRGYAGGNAAENFVINKVADYAFGEAQDAINQGFRNVLPGQGIFGIAVHDMGLTPDGELSVFTGTWWRWRYCQTNEVTGERKEKSFGVYYKREDKSYWYDPAGVVGGGDGRGSAQAAGWNFKFLESEPGKQLGATIDMRVEQQASGKQTATGSFIISYFF